MPRRWCQAYSPTERRSGAAPAAVTATRDSINYVGSSAGLMTTTPSDASTSEMVAGDIATAKAFGERLKAVVAKRG